MTENTWRAALAAYASPATLVLLLGRMLVNRSAWLRKYNIPKPVVGGLLVALLQLLLYLVSGKALQFDTSLQTPLMLAFFASIGLNADLASLRRGGRTVAVFLAVVAGLLLVQNTLGVTLAPLLGLDSHMGLLAGSITLSGGHGTGAAWGSLFSQKYGIASASELAMACATFGLILGGLIGGPVAHRLIKQVKLPEGEEESVPQGFEEPEKSRPITAFSLIETLALIAICLQVGHHVAASLKGSALELPTFVCVLFVGVLLRNGLVLLRWHEVGEREVSLLGNVSLSLFLGIAMITLKLWQLAELALPLLILLAGQTLLMFVFAYFIVFRVMGRDYDAAVISSGVCGFGMGATPNAMANMQALCEKYAPSVKAYLLIPLVGSLFADFINSLVTTFFINFI